MTRHKWVARDTTGLFCSDWWKITCVFNIQWVEWLWRGHKRPNLEKEAEKRCTRKWNQCVTHMRPVFNPSCNSYVTHLWHIPRIRVRQFPNIPRFVLILGRFSAFSAMWTGDFQHRSDIHIMNMNTECILKRLRPCWSVNIRLGYGSQKSVKWCYLNRGSLIWGRWMSQVWVCMKKGLW